MIATARHILVKTEKECVKLMQEIQAGKTTFEKAAKKHSLCPSGARGGDLGTFSQGQMVPEFDKVVFNDELNVVHGPVKTQFGYHLLETTSRQEVKTATARHILVKTEKECLELKKEILSGKTTFEKAAKKSLCPSGKNGGDLGKFTQGQMVPEFDKVVFNNELNIVHGPVKTQFGYHLLETTSRS